MEKNLEGKDGNNKKRSEIDFSKAFDSVNWSFLFSVMRTRGFPDRWIQWIHNLLSSAQSAVLINGESSGFIKHRRGLRQGDPLSPMLFILAADVLQQMIAATNLLLNKLLSSKITDSIMALQYADDTAIVANLDEKTLIFLKIVLRIFTEVSGLKINFAKSNFVPINLTRGEVISENYILGFTLSNFPVLYLGMPLTIKSPCWSNFLPLIEKIERRMQGWKAKMISRGGRLQLVKSVLSSIPIYFMTFFLLPKWVLKRIDHIRQSFLWGRDGNNKRSISLINWECVCLPYRWGGMGVQKLELQNVSLLLRWWWQPYVLPTSLWTTVLLKIRLIGNNTEGPKIWMIGGSFFWRKLRSLMPIFQFCTSWNIGDRRKISYWFDSWNGYPMTNMLQQGERPTQSRISLRNAYPIRHSLHTEEVVFTDIEFTQDTDELLWNWTASQSYSASSAYHTIVGGGRIASKCMTVWSLPIPPKVRVFVYLLINERILTQEMMKRRNMGVDGGCCMCHGNASETALHLLFLCDAATEVWREISIKLGYTLMTAGLTVEEVWINSDKGLRAGGASETNQGRVLFMCVCWNIWNRRNNKIFSRKSVNSRTLVERILVEGRLWLKYCNTGARRSMGTNLLPEPD